MKSKINQKVVIRLAKPEDKYKIVKIQYSALRITAAKDYNHRQIQALLKSKSTFRQSPETIFVAEIDGHPVGFASLLHPPNTIGAVFVSPQFTRRNIGTLLIQTLEQEAIKNKISVLWVCSSLTGYSFYKANGYQTISKTVFPLYSTYIPCIQMKKRLLPATTDEAIKEICQLIIAIIIVILITFFTVN